MHAAAPMADRLAGSTIAAPLARSFRDPSAGWTTQVRTTSSSWLESWFERIAPSPWGAHAGLSGLESRAVPTAQPNAWTSFLTVGEKRQTAPLYTVEERARRDASPWTLVQGVLAPLQFLVCAASFVLILRYLSTGQGYALATGSILLKTVALYAIMVTGSIWERAVFGKWLFARSFFWEDVFSLAVLTLQTAYVACLLTGVGSPRQQMLIAVAAYAAYAINATQFLLKLRAARIEARIATLVAPVAPHASSALAA